jgi:hypothetical protein
MLYGILNNSVTIRKKLDAPATPYATASPHSQKKEPEMLKTKYLTTLPTGLAQVNRTRAKAPHENSSTVKNRLIKSLQKGIDAIV